MSQHIQFPCPVCATTLRVPLAMAACHGPCPHCANQIVAPDPATGIGAFAPNATPLAEELPLSQQPGPPATALPPPPRPAVLILSCLLTGGVALTWGYAWGVRANPAPAPAAVVVATNPAAPVVAPPSVSPESEPTVEAVVAAQIEPSTPPEARPVAALAEATLRAFLDAPDWAARCAHVLQPDEVRQAMETYSHETSDGPTEYQTITVQQGHLDEQSGFTFYIFLVKTAARPNGIPAAVMETPTGWRVDWRAFVEFRDGLFGQFADGPADCSGQFRLAVSVPPTESLPKTAENSHFASLQLHSPSGGAPQLAFIRKDNEDATTIINAVSRGGPFTPVLEVAKRQAPDGQTFLEVTRIVASNWSPRST